MNKKVAVALTGAATVMLAVSGCGSSTSKADDYAKVVCDAAQPQFQKMHNAENDIASVSDGNHTPDQVKGTDSAAFQQISDARKALAQAWSNAGVPPVANGAQLQQDAVKELNDTATAYANLKKTVDGLNTSDQAKFADQLKTVATQLGAVNKIPTPVRSGIAERRIEAPRQDRSKRQAVMSQSAAVTAQLRESVSQMS